MSMGIKRGSEVLCHVVNISGYENPNEFLSTELFREPGHNSVHGS